MTETTNTPDPADSINIVTINTREEMPNIARNITGPKLVSILAAAEQGVTQDLFSLYRDILSDSQIQSEFVKRKGAILGDEITLMPWDKLNPDDVAAKDFCKTLISEPPFASSLSWFLNATIYPVAIVEKQYQYLGGLWQLSALHRVHYQLLDWSLGYLRIRDTDSDGHLLNSYTIPDPARYMVHRGVDLPVPDQWGGPMRALLFWWLLRSKSRQWWADFIERYGQPILLGKYSDPAGKRTLEKAFAVAVRLGGLVISKGTEAEIVSASVSDTSNSHERFIELCNREISKLIVGQTLSSNVQATGMGDGTANLQGQVRDDLRKMDAKLLADTYRHQLFPQALQINGYRGRPPKILFGADSAAEAAALQSTVKGFYDAGLEPTDDGITTLSERSGIPLQRRSQPQSFSPGQPFNFAPLSVKMDDHIASNRAAPLAAAFTGHLAPLKKIIESAQTPSECLRLSEAYIYSTNIANPAAVLAQALTAYAASGLTSAEL